MVIISYLSFNWKTFHWTRSAVQRSLFWHEMWIGTTKISPLAWSKDKCLTFTLVYQTWKCTHFLPNYNFVKFNFSEMWFHLKTFLFFLFLCLYFAWESPVSMTWRKNLQIQIAISIGKNACTLLLNNRWQQNNIFGGN